MKRWLVLLLITSFWVSTLVNTPAQEGRRRPIAVASGTFPGTDTILDNFNRSSVDPLDGSWTQGFQAALDGNLKVVSNTKVAWATAGTTTGASATYNTTYNADQWVRAKIDTRISGSQHCVILRANNAGATNVTGYEICARTNNNDIKIYRWDNSTTVVLLDTITQTLADGDAIATTAVGTLGTVYYKVGAGAWTALTPTFSTATYNTSGKIGLRLNNTVAGTIADDFGGGNQ